MTAGNSPVPDESAAGAPSGGSTAGDGQAERLLLERAIGGWQGVIDSGLPTVVFVVTFLATGGDPAALRYPIIAAVAVGVVILAWRLIRRQRVQQVLAGFVGVAISAWFTSRTGRAEDYFVRGLVTNAAYLVAFAVSLAIRWPLIGVAMGFLTSEGTRWRQDTTLRRTYTAATWIWVALFAARLAVQVPLYLAKNVAALGFASLIMGWPLFLAAAYLTYRLLAPVYRARRAATSQHEDGSPRPAEPGDGGEARTEK